MYCPASRAAVYKRIKEGRLSIFLFHVTCRKTTLFGKNKILREQPYGYVPVSEARSWRKELEDRAVEQGLITIKALEGSKPDWEGEFLRWKNKRERAGPFNGEDAVTVGELATALFKLVVLRRNVVEMKPRKKRGKGESK